MQKNVSILKPKQNKNAQKDLTDFTTFLINE